MTAPAVPVVLAAPALAAAAAAVFPEARLVALARQEMRPARPFEGRLFATLASLPAGTCVGLVVPLRLVAAAGRHTPAAPESRAPGEPPTDLFAVEDHVDLELRGPLTGPWPAGVPRSFPSMTGRYQPSVVRCAGGPRVYSGGVVAGVGDLARLTPFERAALRCAGCLGAADLLVPPAVAAAYYGHTLAACGVVQGSPIDEE
ncbi:MAG: hypothetical protein V2J16_10970 [Thermoleophilia bacterium]|nr:hypothetical protein [Thermoleophilia bacterium]